MTTNSPNPVDGDAQALIEQCKDNIDKLTVALKHCEQDEAVEIQRNIELQKIALASLTAEPVIYAIQNEDERENGYMTEFSSSGIAGYVNPEKYGLTELALYTTPPAKLLRQVELPPKSDVKMGGDAKTRALLTGMNMMLKSCIEVLRQQGYEVKND